MREVVYVILAIAVPGPALAFEGLSNQDTSNARHHSAAKRIDLRTPAILSWSTAVLPSAAPAAARGLLTKPEDLPLVAPVASVARGALAWALPAGLSFFAAGNFGQTTLTSQPAWPLGATVPAVKTSAAIALTLDSVAGSPLSLNLSVNRNWQLDGPIGGTFPDCAVRLDVTAEAAPRISFQVPCGAAGHFGVGLRGGF